MIDILHEEYGYILPPEAIGMYYIILNLGGNGSVTLDEMKDTTGLSDNEVKSILKILRACDLIFIPDLKKKQSVKIVNPPKGLIYENKISLVEKLAEKGIIDQAKLPAILEKLRRQEVRLRKSPRKKPEDFAFNSSKKLNPDTPKGLISYYYKTLSDTFGNVFRSHNEVKEASQLKNSMIKNNDAPDMVRRMFNFIITSAKNRNRFDEVSSLKFYGNQRNNAFNKVAEEGAVSSRFAEPVEQTEGDAMENINRIYERYTGEKGMTHVEAMIKMKMSFDIEILKRFSANMKERNDKQISIH